MSNKALEQVGILCSTEYLTWSFKRKGPATKPKSSRDVMAGDVTLTHSLQYFVLWPCNVMYKCSDFMHYTFILFSVPLFRDDNCYSLGLNRKKKKNLTPSSPWACQPPEKQPPKWDANTAMRIWRRHLNHQHTSVEDRDQWKHLHPQTPQLK